MKISGILNNKWLEMLFKLKLLSQKETLGIDTWKYFLVSWLFKNFVSIPHKKHCICTFEWKRGNKIFYPVEKSSK